MPGSSSSSSDNALLETDQSHVLPRGKSQYFAFCLNDQSSVGFKARLVCPVGNVNKLRIFPFNPLDSSPNQLSLQKCDGARPICNQCTRHNRPQECVYEAKLRGQIEKLENRVKELEQLITRAESSNEIAGSSKAAMAHFEDHIPQGALDKL